MSIRASQICGHSCVCSANIKETSKVRITGSLWREPPSDDRWIPHTKGQWCGKRFPVMKTSWRLHVLYYTIPDTSRLEQNHVADDTFKCIFSKGLSLFKVHCSLLCNWQWVNICPGNGLAPNRRQVITRTSDIDPAHRRIHTSLDLNELICETAKTRYARTSIHLCHKQPHVSH